MNGIFRPILLIVTSTFICCGNHIPDIRLEGWGEGSYTIWHVIGGQNIRMSHTDRLSELRLRPGDYLITHNN